ncbi:hypothetical protein SAMN06265795_102421 [Noviherbaspirillum humi]|uniref:UPF0434 protein SAMN06265795_102421 n=1 Tax=Noviherbaspirillum humi TaxID=1688639 RepID=A0A239DZQ2_9BURK|nr:hypothetical protein SAMN06265795_102421 [Noviherbaspirillum humi]
MPLWSKPSWRNGVDARLLDILVCPICKGPLQYDKNAQELICRPDKLAFPIRDGIPIMWADQARDIDPAAKPVPPAA